MTPEETHMTTTLPRPQLANASAVTPWLFIGGDLSPDPSVAVEQRDELVRLGVTHVVDCRAEWSDAEHWSGVPSVAYTHHGIDDAGQTIAPVWFDRAVGIVRDARTDPHAVVLTHCHMGINRGPTLGLAALLDAGWDVIEAMDAIRRARPIAYVWYAEQALAWHHLATGATPDVRRADTRALRQWRAADSLDVGAVIRRIRMDEELS